MEGDIGVRDKLDQYGRFNDILAEAEECSEGDYRVIVKWRKISNRGHRTYDNCLGAPFLLYSSGDGRLYPCGMWFDTREEEFRMGDLTEMTFKEIIESDAYWASVERQSCHIDVHKECYSNCRTHEINNFVWTLRHPPPHVNFV